MLSVEVYFSHFGAFAQIWIGLVTVSSYNCPSIGSLPLRFCTKSFFIARIAMLCCMILKFDAPRYAVWALHYAVFFWRLYIPDILEHILGFSWLRNVFSERKSKWLYRVRNVFHPVYKQRTDSILMYYLLIRVEYALRTFTNFQLSCQKRN